MVNVSFAQQANKPTSATQSSTQLNPIVLNIPGAYQTTNGKINIVRSYDVFKWGMDDNDVKANGADPKEVMLSSQYLDGLGRPIQQVMRKGSPDKKDIVQMKYYDAFGREVQSFLPYTSNSQSDGTFKVSPFLNQQTIYNSHLGGKEDIFYGVKEFESSPRSRVLKQMMAGNSWAGNGVGRRSQVFTNTVIHGVQKWAIGNMSTDIPVNGGEYVANELSLTIVTDEDGRIMRSFTDKSNNIILKQIQLTSTPSESHVGWLSTYYIYDTRGNLRFVIPPKGVDELLNANWDYAAAKIDELVFKYVYDERSRGVIQKLPGAEDIYTIYDNLDRPVLTQNGVQRVGNKWTFTKFDEKNRPVITGLIDLSHSRYDLLDDRSELQSEADNWGAKDYFVKKQGCDLTGVIEGQSVTVSEHVSGTSIYRGKDFVEFLPGFETDEDFATEIGGSICGDYTYYQGYYDATFPLLKNYGEHNDFEVLNINYFDDYDFSLKTWDDDFSGFYESQSDINDFRAIIPSPYMITQGLPTVSKIRVLGDEDKWLTSVIFYDDRGRVIQTQSESHLGGYDIVTTQYDFAGNILHTYNKHNNPNAGSDHTTRILKRFIYDDNGRLEKVEEKLGDTGVLKTLLTNSYNELGQLESKKLGADPNTPSSPLETLNYQYNIRGWLKSVNDDFVTSGTGGHYFGMDLSYDYGFEKKELSGNIAGVKWRSKSGTRKRAYGFSYDKANRLSSADYNHWDNVQSEWSKNVPLSGTRDFSSAYTYDANGNIETLKRNGVISGESFIIDDLVYTYGVADGNGGINSLSNQLLKIEETIASPSLPEGFNNTNGASDDYAHDENGNLVLDSNKGVLDVKYNDLNLPEKVIFTGGRDIAYDYDASGRRLSKTVNSNGDITRTDYSGAFVYQDNELQFFSHEEGRVRKNYQGNLVHDYFITDYLGNIRMTLTEVPEVIEYRATMEKDIMPTGVNLEDYEESLFLNLEETRESPSNHNTTSILGITNDESVRLNGTDLQRRIGPAKMLAVFPGDQVSLSVQSFHTGGASTTYVDTESQTIDALASVFSQLGGSTTTTEGALKNLFQGPGTMPSIYVGSQGNINKPRAYLNYLVLNQDFEYIDGGFIQADQTNGWKTLSTNLNITEGGFVYIYLSNEHPTSFNVWFDDLTIVHTKSTILQEDHYYPYGMNIDALSGKAPQAKSNNFKYNGFEEQTDFDLGWYDYQARQYDPQIGRFLSVDPAAGSMKRHSPYNYAFDNPIRFIDPDGMTPEEPTGAYGETFETAAVDHYYFGDGVGGANGGWYQTADSDVHYHPRATSQAAFDQLGIDGTYIGNVGWIDVDWSYSYNGEERTVTRTYFLDSNGSVQYISPEWKLELVGAGDRIQITPGGQTIHSHDDRPSRLRTKNGEKFRANDNEDYQLYDKEWVKLSGMKVDVMLMSVANVPSMYIPNSANFVDYNIAAKMMGDDQGTAGNSTLLGYVVGVGDGMFRTGGTYKEVLMPNFHVMGVVIWINTYRNKIKKGKSNIEHNKQVELDRRNYGN